MNVQILVKANHHVNQDTMVFVQVERDLKSSNYVTLRFANGDYYKFDVNHYRETERYITTYENVYARDAFIEKLKNGEITIEEGGKQ